MLALSSRATTRRMRALAWSVGTWFALAACGAEEVDTLPIERLAFVPGGQVQVGGQSLGAREPLLVDRYEVTRAEWAERFPEEASDEDGLEAIPLSHPQWPAVGMEIAAAQEFAQARDMRLPTVREWLWIAGGTRAMAYPYGINRVESAANTLNLKLYRPTPVGTFANGRTPGDPIFDLQGNAAEWAWADHWEGSSWRPYAGAPGQSVAWAMGGSYMTHNRPLYRFLWDGVEVNALRCDPGYRSSDLGLRCVVEARAYLMAQQARWQDERYAERLRKVGERWGRRAVELLSELAEQYPDSAMLRQLLQGARGR